MNNKTIIITVLAFLFFLTGYTQKAFDYSAQWHKVEQLKKQGLPKSAINIVNDIYVVAKKDNDTPQFIKALLNKVALNSKFEIDYNEKTITLLEKEIISADNEVQKAVLHSVIGQLYTNYYQNNRYVISKRSKIDNVGDDIKTWDITKILQEADNHYSKSLENINLLSKESISKYYDIIIKGKDTEHLRPTLFDFLAFRALDYYNSSDFLLSEANLEINFSDEGLFSDFDFFSNINFPSEKKYSSLKIFQQLLKIHKENHTAFIHVDLERLKYVKEKFTSSNKEDLYVNALEKLSEKLLDTPEWANVQYALANEYFSSDRIVNDKEEDNRWNKKTALDYCNKAIDKYPKSYGASHAEALKKKILKRDLNIAMSRENLPQKSFEINISHKNIDKLYFRIVKISPDDEWRKLKDKEEKLSALTQKKSVKEWCKIIEKEEDYNTHQLKLSVSELDKGNYILLAATSPQFSLKEQYVSLSEFWVTDIAYFSDQYKGKTTIYVVERESGHRIKNAEVKCYNKKYDYKTRSYTKELIGEYKTNSDGEITLSYENVPNKLFNIDITKGDDRFVSDNNFYVSKHNRRDRIKYNTYYFTDRSIYRPGQIVYFKGLTLKKENNNTSIEKNHKSTVRLIDANNQLISKKEYLTNENGTFSGSFILPDETLNGNYRIVSESGRINFSVQEYKVPKYTVEMLPVTEVYSINDTVSIIGKAMALAGYPVDGAKVTYIIKRDVNIFTPYYRRHIPYNYVSSVVLKSGETSTNKEGDFEIDFIAKPDLGINKASHPLFKYTLSIDITDKNGETHNKEVVVSLGYDSFVVDVNIDDEIEKNEKFEIEPFIYNFNNERIAATGDIKVYKLDDFKQLNSHNYSANNNSNDLLSKQSIDKLVFSATFNTSDSLFSTDITDWEIGAYKIIFEARVGEEIKKVEKYFTLFDKNEDDIPLNEYAFFKVLKTKAEPGETVPFIFGSNAKKVDVYIFITQEDKIIEKKKIRISREQQKIEIPVQESFRGNFDIVAMFVKDNHYFFFNKNIQVPFSNKNLDIQFITFRNKLKPGDKETWKLKITDNENNTVSSELLAAMYDASLDEIKVHNWYFNINPTYYSAIQYKNSFSITNDDIFHNSDNNNYMVRYRDYDKLNWFGYNQIDFGIKYADRKVVRAQALNVFEEEEVIPEVNGKADKKKIADIHTKIDLRKNFSETAFFYPELKTNQKGEVEFSFVLPESLTKWKLMLFAHTNDLKSAITTKDIIASKELMVIPNKPRFLRKGDKYSFSAKVVNLSDKEKNITVSLDMFGDIDESSSINITNNKREITVAAGESKLVVFPIQIPDDFDLLTYKIVAVTDGFSDGEQNIIPVLSNRKLITDTKAFSFSKAGEQKIDFNEIKNINSGVKAHKLTLEYTGNAAWYAVQALPYIEQNSSKSVLTLANSFYSNSIAKKLLLDNPVIEDVFKQWKALKSDALQSNLEKNAELKNILIQNTPWLVEAKDESQQKQRIALFFDDNKINNELQQDIYKLAIKQTSNGGWAWYNGMKESRYITQNIVEMLGHLYTLGAINIDAKTKIDEIIKKALMYIDDEMLVSYNVTINNKNFNDEKYIPSSIDIQYLYSRSFFLKDYPINDKYQEAVSFIKDHAYEKNNKYNIYQKALIGLSLNRFGEHDKAMSIVASLKEYSNYSEEYGMYWRNFNRGWNWYQAPIENQATLIELFHEVAQDNVSVEKMKLWLLKQKQTQRWSTSSATVKAIYALLSTSNNMLNNTGEKVNITVGTQKIDISQEIVEAGTSYFKKSWDAADITSDMSDIIIDKEDNTVSWGALYWQYFSDLDQVKNSSTGIKVVKQLYKVEKTDKGEKLIEIGNNSSLSVGDRVRVRMVLTSDRDMEFVHLQDMRAASFEPADNISSYHYQDGLGYYQAINDVSTDFFISSLPRGKYVFEYDLFTEHKGDYSNGIATFQSIYAPEYSSHSKGVRVVIE